ncbi:hypothetical protein LJR234_002146 [Mesorhizobium amorphae]|uniref:hypothetical protein n=1 Tax=Mesorhizobium amorphae TaxID=71433 RepID=UPI003ECF5BBC
MASIATPAASASHSAVNSSNEDCKVEYSSRYLLVMIVQEFFSYYIHRWQLDRFARAAATTSPTGMAIIAAPVGLSEIVGPFCAGRTVWPWPARLNAHVPFNE